VSSDPFTDLADSLEGFIAALRSLMTTSRPGLGSRAFGEAAGKPYPGDWGEHPSRDVLAGGLLLLVWSCCDHLSAAVALLRGRTHIPSLYTLMRAAAEAAGSAYYLAAMDIDPLERVRRYMNWRINALCEENNMIRPICAPNSGTEESVAREAAAQVADNEEQIASIGRAGQHYGLKFQKQNGLSAAYLGAKPPSIIKLIDECSSESPGLGNLQYRHLSAVAHAQLHGLKRFLSREGIIKSDIPDQVFTQLEIKADVLALHLMVAPLCATGMAQRLCRFTNWDIDEVGPWITRMLATWGRIAGTTYPGPIMKDEPQ
jgi:hypothetical protein